jgi:hypothetical protein
MNQASGARMLPGLADPRDLAAYQKSTQAEYIFSANDQENARYHRLADLQSDAQVNAKLRGVRSNRENLEADITQASGYYDAARARGGDVGAHQQTEVARDLGDKLTDYAESMTHAGAQVGANDINSAAGAGMVMGAEYQMDESVQTAKMVDALLEIAKNTGHMSKGLADQVQDQLGFRQSDPISNIFGGMFGH